MGFAETIKHMFGRGRKAAAENPDAVKKGIDQAADKIDDATGHKMSGNIDKGSNMAKDAVDKHGKKN